MTSTHPLGVDTEALIIAGLGRSLPAVEASTKVPNPRPVKFVKVTRTGGPPREQMVLDTSTHLVQVWAPSSSEAIDLALEVQKSICDFEGVMVADSSFVVEATCTNPASFPDPDTDSPRYTMQAVLVVHT